MKEQDAVQIEFPIPLELVMTLIALYTPFLIIPFILVSYLIYFGLNYIWNKNKVSIYFGDSDN